MSSEDVAPKKEKIGLLDMILFAEEIIGDVDTWEHVLHSEGEQLYPGMARRRDVMHRIAATLELVKAHEKKFVALVQEAQRQAMPPPERQKPTTE